MTKNLKKLYITILTTLFLACVGFLLFSPVKSVGAIAMSGENDDYKNDITFLSGASIEIEDFANDTYTLGFRVKSNKARHDNLTKWGNLPYADISPGLGMIAPNQYIYNFTLYRLNENGESIPISKYRISYRWTWGDGRMDNIQLVSVVAKKEESHYGEQSFYFEGLPEYNTKTLHEDERYCLNEEKSHVESLGYEIVSSGLTNSTSLFTNPLQYVCVTVDSAIAQYYVELNWQYYWRARYNFFYIDEYDTIEHTVKSEVRSFHDVLKNMYDYGELEEVFEDLEFDYPGVDFLAKANAILSDSTIKTIQVKYLVQLGDSPFATHVYKHVKVPLLNGVSNDDVYSALNVANVDCLASFCSSFVYNSAKNVYEADYDDKIMFRAMTEDSGRYADYPLSINLSYKDYYEPFIKGGKVLLDDGTEIEFGAVMTDGWYEVILSGMREDYPSIRGKSADEVYGYFGMVVIPDTLSINTIWNQVFDVETSTAGVCQRFSWNETLTAEAYNTLLDHFRYTWPEQLWNLGTSVFTECTASFNMFYAQPGVREGIIGEGGQTDFEDTDSALKDGIQQGATDLKEITDNIWDFITSPFKSKLGLSSILIVGAVVVVAYLYFTGKLKPGSSKGKSKNKKRRK